MIDEIKINLCLKEGTYSTAYQEIKKINAISPNEHLKFNVEIFRKDDSISIGDNSNFNNVQIHSNFQKNDADNRVNLPTD